MHSLAAYRALAGTVGIFFIVAGLALFATFIGYQAPDSTPVVSTGPMGHYFVAATGCALVAWGGALLNTARHPQLAPALATPTAFALTLMAVYRMLAWVVGDYHHLGDVLRFEAGLFLVLALAFMWVRPASRLDSGAAGTPAAQRAGAA